MQILLERYDMEEATELKKREMKLISVDNKEFATGDDITLPCHLSPETSAVGMEIRWFKGTECIYLYKSGHVTVREDYEGRVSLNTQRLHWGDVSLRLKESREEDTGRYGCQIISGDLMEGSRIGLRYDGGRKVIYSIHTAIPDLVMAKMEKSVKALVNQRTEEIERLNSKKMKSSEHHEGRNTRRADSVHQKRENTLHEEKIKELTNTAQQLKELMTKQGRAGDKPMENMMSVAEKRKQQVLALEKELQHRSSQLQVLRSQNSTLLEKVKQLEERNKQLDLRDPLGYFAGLHEQDLSWRRWSMDQPPRLRRQRLVPSTATSGSDPVTLFVGIHDQDSPHRLKRQSMDLPVYFKSPGPAPPVSPAVSKLRLVLLGGSAAGKRAAGNTILGTHTLTHTSTKTQHSESRQGKVAGRRVTVVETPDWFCNELSETVMRQDVGHCVRLSAPGPHAFLLVIPVEPSEGEERRMLEKIEDIFGEGCWGHTMILFTHTEEQRERSVEELLQTGSQELQQLVEKCGNRCHLLNVKDRHDDTQIKQLLEKIAEMVSGNRERFYSSETYQEAERQSREIEKRLQNKQQEEVEERKLREERKKREEVDKEKQESMKKIEEEIQQHETEIRMINRRISELERKIKEARDEETQREMERQLKHEISLWEGKKAALRDIRERERREVEKRHREEMEEMRESYEREARTEAERNLMKIILPELQRNINIFKENMEAEFNRKIEDKNRMIETVLWELRERDATLEKLTQRQSESETELETAMLNQEQEREMERMRHMLEEKDREIQRMRLKLRREGSLTENERLKQIGLKMSREMEKLRQEVNNLSHTQTLLREICEAEAETE